MEIDESDMYDDERFMRHWRSSHNDEPDMQDYFDYLESEPEEADAWSLHESQAPTSDAPFSAEPNDASQQRIVESTIYQLDNISDVIRKYCQKNGIPSIIDKAFLETIALFCAAVSVSMMTNIIGKRDPRPFIRSSLNALKTGLESFSKVSADMPPLLLFERLGQRDPTILAFETLSVHNRLGRKQAGFPTMDEVIHHVLFLYEEHMLYFGSAMRQLTPPPIVCQQFDARFRSKIHVQVPGDFFHFLTAASAEMFRRSLNQ